MGNNIHSQNAEVENARGESQLKLNHTKLYQTGFGDMQIKLWRDNAGNPYVTFTRGQPMQKTFCIEHFLNFAKEVRDMEEKINERVGL